MADVVERLLVQAARTPDAAAVVEPPRVTTYAAFVERAAAFAAAFGTAQPRVLIALDKGCNAYAAMFGTLMAGGIYAPVNVASPLARLRHVGEIFDPDVLVAHEPLAHRLAEGTRAIVLDPSRPLQGLDRAAPPAFNACVPATRAPDSLAYVIFTSGSTGAPKGVAISRSALAHYVDWLGPALAIGPDDRMSQHPNIGFDLSVLDIFGALCYGAALYPFIAPSARLLPARKVREAGITIWSSVPSVVSAMEAAGELDAAHLASVRLFTFCGEVLRQDLVARLFAARPDAVVLNTYGPTEATVAMTCRRLTADTFEALCSPSAPLGTAIGEMRLDLVGRGDASDGDVSEGEIVISGPQVAAGYWGDQDLTDARFREAAIPAGRVRAFYTGDLARRVGGELYFLGRSDDMIKLRGHRIHLGEIGKALARLGWRNAFAFEAGGSIYAAVEALEDQTFDEARIRDGLSGLLDSHFVPQAVRCVDRFPRTPNDKIDGAAIMALFG